MGSFSIDSSRYLVTSEVTSKFDDLTVEYHDTELSFKCLLVDDTTNEVITVLHSFLTRALRGDLELPDNVDFSRGAGFCWNEWAHNLPEQGDYEPDYSEDFWVWSTKDTSTWLYRIRDEVFLEISPLYRWHFEEPQQGNELSYADFKSGFKEIVRVAISREILLKWKLQCETLFSLLTQSE